MIYMKWEYAYLLKVNMSKLKKDLYPFQKEGVAFIEEHYGRVLVADDQGLGKTIQSLAWLQLHPEARPVIIVAPATVKINWQREAYTWMTNPKVEVISGGKAHKIKGEIIIINYDILTKWVKRLITIGPKVIILDECHFIKNRGIKPKNESDRTKAVKRLCKKAKHVIGLSGTPIVNRPLELINIVNIICPKLFPSSWRYVKRYCDAKFNGFGWDYNGATNIEELHNILTRNLMIRRLKKDVLKDLPPKTRTVIPVEINGMDEYEKAEDDFIGWLHSIDPKGMTPDKLTIALIKIEHLKRLTIAGKMKGIIDWIKNFLDTGEKLVVTFTHRNTASVLVEKFPNISTRVDGTVRDANRQKAVDAFNDDKIRLFLGNLKVMIGINLQAHCSNMLVVELGWVGTELLQAEDRLHRIGQKKGVNIWYIIGCNTVEERILKLLVKKQRIVESVLDGKPLKDKSTLDELLTEMRNKK